MRFTPPRRGDSDRWLGDSGWFRGRFFDDASHPFGLCPCLSQVASCLADDGGLESVVSRGSVGVSRWQAHGADDCEDRKNGAVCMAPSHWISPQCRTLTIHCRAEGGLIRWLRHGKHLHGTNILVTNPHTARVFTLSNEWTRSASPLCSASSFPDAGLLAAGRSCSRISDFFHGSPVHNHLACP